MRKVIGIVGEGPVDQMVLKAAINKCRSASKLDQDIRQWMAKIL
jgi:hypothetical protein